MPRVYRTPKEYEQFLIRRLLRRMGYRITRATWQERPDALLTVVKDRSKTILGIEHMDYFNDVLPGKVSPLTGLGWFWRIVQTSLCRRLNYQQHLRSLMVIVEFRDPFPKPPRTPTARLQLARDVAAELVRLALSNPLTPGEHRTLRTFPPECPRLSSLLSQVRFMRAESDIWQSWRMAWTCSNLTAGDTGFIVRHLTAAIQCKTRKSATYNWRSAEKKWLLITASGATPAQCSASEQIAEWNDPDLRKAAPCSGFDRILFWDYPHDWCYEIWPGDRLLWSGHPDRETSWKSAGKARPTRAGRRAKSALPCLSQPRLQCGQT